MHVLFLIIYLTNRSAELVRTIIAWKALGRDCTNNNGLILQIGVLSS